ncbi:MAG: flippase-like domain-containing protein [Methanomassiliicoccus sp.]|nr:flippase-like domain-containing protein [Methanomassiliicoccus sp.]
MKEGGRWKRYAPITVVSIILVAGLVVQAGPWKLADRLAGADLGLVGWAIGLYLVAIAVRALRWHLLLVASEHRVRGGVVLSQYTVGQALNDLTPFRVVGEAARIWGVNQQGGVPLGTGLATVMAEKVMDLVLITTVLMASVVVLFPDEPLRTWAPLAVISGLVAAVNLTLIVVLRRPDIVQWGGGVSNRFARRFRGGRYAGEVEKRVGRTIDSFDLARQHSRTASRSLVLAAAALTVPIWFLEFSRLMLIMAAVGVFPSLPAVVVASALAMTFQVFLPGGSGNVAVISDVFSGMGVALATATAAGLLSVATSIWISVPLALVALLLTGRNLRGRDLSGTPLAASDPSTGR